MDILVSGAGIAGLACALELGTRGHAVTVVESAPHLRTAGTPIDRNSFETVEQLRDIAGRWRSFRLIRDSAAMKSNTDPAVALFVNR